MLCCAGLIGGMVVGQYLGGPWTVIAPAAGFGIGLAADMKFMNRCHMSGSGRRHETKPQRRPESDRVLGMQAEENSDEASGKREKAQLAPPPLGG